MEKIFKIVLIFLIGASSYGIIELSFRGFTHWSMVLTGGACLVSLYYINLSILKLPIFYKALIGAIVITTYEFFVGLIVNKWFLFNVWDYSQLRYNVLGQICPLFSFAWFFLSLVLATIWFFFYNIKIRKITKDKDEIYVPKEL